ncbi:MAG: nucleotide sugar dehydrogenase [Promethearchaeati archaeon SRVP18_Atabeyarchaeia-1]
MNVLYSSPPSLKTGLREGKIIVAVYGLGHVGLGIAAAWLRAGAKVIGIDVKDEVVKSINEGVSPISDEPGVPEAIRDGVKRGKLNATTDGIKGSRESDVKIIAVPTTLTSKKSCDLSALERALQAIGQGMKKGDLVIVESSVPPTTTKTVAEAILEKTSRLKVEEDFGLAYSPERIYEGRVLEDIEKRYPKILGGTGPRSAEAAAALYEAIAQKGVIKLANPTAAETSKLFEGIYRDVNIALANELARFCGTVGVDFKVVREAANSQPFCHLHIPGFVGGWCIPYYPHFVLQAAIQKGMQLPLTALARKINDEKTQSLIEVADSVLREINRVGLRRSRVAVLGLSFRADVADTRNSPSYAVIDLLLMKGVAGIVAYDPFIKRDALLEQKGVRVAGNVAEATRDANLILVMTDHSAFREKLTPEDLFRFASSPAVLIDGRDVLASENSRVAPSAFFHRIVEGFHVFTRRAG